MSTEARQRLALVLGVWACLGFVSCGGDDPEPLDPGWILLEASPVSPTGRHEDVFFLDELRGWLVNTRGAIHRTTDGGRSWRVSALPPDPPVFLRCVGFVSPSRGFAGNFNNFNGPRPDLSLFETNDSGQTWTNISARIQGPPVAGLCGMRVVSPTAIYAVGRWNGPAVFVKTNDAGQTWTSVSLASLASGLVDLHFFDEQTGLAVGSLGDGNSIEQQEAARTVILGTSDGGATWQPRYLSQDRGQRAWKIDFPTRQIGYVSTEGASPEGVVLKTTDGGLSWQRLPVAAGISFEGIGFVSAERGWVGHHDSMFETLDGGATWRRLEFGNFVNRIRILRPDLVYASGLQVYRWTPEP